MKILKQNDGYALPFVLVVSVVICIIATTVMTFSLNNLQSQQKTIERMQAKYAASSLVEEIVAATQSEQEVEIYFDEQDEITIGEKTVKITTIGTSNNGEVQVQLVAEIELLELENGTITNAELKKDNDNRVLTVSYCGEITYNEYRYSIASVEEASS